MRRLRAVRALAAPHQVTAACTIQHQTTHARTIDQAMSLIEQLLHKHAPTNTAPIPIAIALENFPEGPRWTVDLHIRLLNDNEYALYAEDEIFSNALTAMAKQLRNEVNSIPNHTGTQAQAITG